MGPADNLKYDWIESSEAGQIDLGTRIGQRPDTLMQGGGDWAESCASVKTGERTWGRSLRGRCRVGSQRSVNSGDVMLARWRKGELVVPLSGVGAWVLQGLGYWARVPVGDRLPVRVRTELKGQNGDVVRRHGEAAREA